PARRPLTEAVPAELRRLPLAAAAVVFHAYRGRIHRRAGTDGWLCRGVFGVDAATIARGSRHQPGRVRAGEAAFGDPAAGRVSRRRQSQQGTGVEFQVADV